MSSVVIIRGNPKYHKEAFTFYRDLEQFLIALDFYVSWDDGVEYTKPPKADVWIGYSRGIDRLRFACASTKTIGIGGIWDTSVNHPQDNTIEIKSGKITPNKYHFILAKEMKKKKKKLLNSTL